ncbi:Serine/threonine-protein kinase par-4 [Caenorhabditis elegans]|uniref:Serine/threonine-protein kinase par-4 n=2 Tax=Caenorhabditis elegans TaxID=6239 RepID=PAR4_CAEEL|nr:Serine/threonine-protein kinase par-4 [Caenorhabditis elegans]Q9GN62.2 RecName: Full=Serine/threonine-protein kinase par-4 [Caenorhabditis elegans]AAD45355.1 putative serine-threonine kinase PAR-4 [Caenorhabditis elegans]CAC14418.2 Serine/threonine-protein kinase par-4 [Caenorhabditis elegans]|eukprot:NP_001256778.1 Serine/threonine-protein kinase par-4 [Caenorhabditis elegans]
MDAPSTSSGAQSKLLMPGDDEADEDHQNRGDPNLQQKQKIQLNVDPDYDDDEDDDCFIDGCEASAPITRELVDGAIERRSKDRNVKMSIGVYDEYDDDDDDEEETEEDQRRRFVEGIRNIRHKQQESFDLEEHPIPVESEAMRQFINQQVNNAMMFNQDNSEFQHIEFEPIVKQKGPKIIEGYMWGGQIGTGSYGKVKECIDMYTLTRRAVKIMKYDKLRKITNGWENIRSEMSILRRMNHRNVIKLIEIFNIPAKGKVYMVFEYCIGSVQQLLDMEPARRLTIGESHAIFIELCQGLNYLHSKRVSHKDIKPGNLLVSIDFTVKICDFGVAEQINLFQRDGRCTKVNGTPKFQPPECIYGNHDFFDGYKADMWSAGVTLYNLVSGKYPFEKPVLLKLYECIGTEPLQMPTNVQLTKDLQDLLTKLLEKDFNERPTCLETMIHPWFLSTFPEDQGLGRIMERMRTGDRPLTMLSSMTALYDGITPEDELIIEDNLGIIQQILPINLTSEAVLERGSFPGFKFLEAKPGDGPDGVEGSEDSAAPLGPQRRPSSRSMPTCAPPGPAAGNAQNSTAENGAETDGVASASDPPPTAAPGAPPRRRKRNFFSCIFRSRTDSA